jgi:hypothetical protein
MMSLATRIHDSHVHTHLFLALASRLLAPAIEHWFKIAGGVVGEQRG